MRKVGHLGRQHDLPEAVYAGRRAPLFFRRWLRLFGNSFFRAARSRPLKGAIGGAGPMNYGDPGRGQWITILASREHAYIIIAGLRLDTTDFRFGARAGPRWHEYLRLGVGFQVRHPVGL